MPQIIPIPRMKLRYWGASLFECVAITRVDLTLFLARYCKLHQQHNLLRADFQTKICRDALFADICSYLINIKGAK